MAYQSDRTGSNIDQVLDFADDGKTGQQITDLSLLTAANNNKFIQINGSEIPFTSQTMVGIRAYGTTGRGYLLLGNDNGLWSVGYDTAGVAGIWRQVDMTAAAQFLTATQEQCLTYLSESQREINLDVLTGAGVAAAVTTRRTKAINYLIANPITFSEPKHDLIDPLP